MGAIGNKPRKYRTTEEFEEPEMLVDLETIRKKAIDGGYINGHRLDIERFIKENFKDITIIKQEMASDVSGKLVGKDGQWVMIINSLHPEVRQRYTMGHELGHYLNHRKTNKSFEDGVFFRNKQKSSMEYIADQFAARLLMPEACIQTLLTEGVNTVRRMAALFDVSLEAMRYRLEELGYSVRKK